MNQLLKTYNIVNRIDCGHTRNTKGAGTTILDWDVTDKDEIVTDLPAGNIIEIHKCAKITVWQEYKGLTRYFLIKEI